MIRLYFILQATLLTTSGFAQDTTALLKERFQNFQQNALTEKLFVHTDKSFYMTGETIFMKVYAVDGLFNKSLDVSKVAYIEILNGDNQSVVQAKIELKKGLGSGAVEIPANLRTGNHKMVAYTSWMRNFDQKYFFEKEITIFNAIIEAEQRSITTGSVNKIAAQFFPEGGNLVAGLKSKVAFQVTDASGLGIQFKGAVVNQSNDTIVRFKPHIFGIGNFEITPASGNTYRAVIQSLDGAKTTEALPSVFENGFVMNVGSSNPSSITVSVATNMPTQQGKPVYLFVHTRGGLLTALKQIVSPTGTASFPLNVDQLGDGVTHITIFDNALKPVCERLYFKQPANVMTIDARVPKSLYQKRENVNVAIQTSTPSKAATSASLSLSVFKVDDLQSAEQTSIINHLFLTSDLAGYVQNPSYYLNSSDKLAIDNLMLTHGWRRFRWEDVQRSSYPVVQFNPDVEGMTIRAKITDSLGNALPNANAFLSVVSKQLQFYPGMTNTRGIVQFYTKDFFGKSEIVVHPFGKAMRYQVSLISPFADNHQRHPVSNYNVPTTVTDLLTSYSIHSQVQRAFQSGITSIQPAVDSMAFYGPADKSYLLSDYTTFPTIGEVLKEYVPEVIVRRKNKKAQLFALDKDRQVFFEAEPLILIDGVPVFDTDLIITLSPVHIKKIELLNEKFFYGPFILNGIISLKSYNGDLGGFKLPREAFVFDYEGLQLNKEFYHPHYTTDKNSRTPDFRNVLIWNPSITTSSKGKAEIAFPTSDVKGKFVGVIQGISRDGLPGFQTFSFEVRETNQ